MGSSPGRAYVEGPGMARWELGFAIFSLRKWDLGRDCELGFEQNVSWKMRLNENDRVLYTRITSPHPGPSC